MRRIIDNSRSPEKKRHISGITGICAKPTLRAIVPISTPHLSPVNSSMSIARKLSKPPEAALTSSFRSLPKARAQQKHSKPKTL